MNPGHYDHGTDMTNVFTFCVVSGNPPAWGCSLCGWGFALDDCSKSLESTPLEQAKSAHRMHVCDGIKRPPAA
jgi:hypothetical protein